MNQLIKIKNPEQIERMRRAGVILASCHREIAKLIKPGISTWEIDEFVEQYLAEHSAIPEQKGYMGYKYATCASINDEVCHGFPRKAQLLEGDIVTIDMVVNLNGWLADSAWSYAVGKISPDAKRLLKLTKESLYQGIEKAQIGNRIGDISHAIQTFAEANGLSVVRPFIGHGIGSKMHEAPEVPHFGPAGKGPIIQEGMTFTIEPMLNLGKHHVQLMSDGWTAKTVDGSLSAQYEHTLAITANGPIILTDQG
ncbi:type I methionyl aminopeptidase [Thermoactinomyces sp. DSM 45891]|uniref:type I methionyl aminopeptidase n=1 Tax=Thermoactinomyces sp. DSM 45891 TaxID=1761907 RepID=UPI000A9977AC|nr:type I methionyl aminopeptidase [Thermoactinomyces sp. DSM 45891]